jgi:hypothetical protein
VSFRAQAFLRYLREASVVSTSAPAVARPQRVIEYAAWMRDRRGLAAATIGHSLPVAQALLSTVSDDPAQLEAACVRRFVLEYIRRHAPASAGGVTTIVRCFLRWLVMQDRCATDLIAAAPTAPPWRLAWLPRAAAIKPGAPREPMGGVDEAGVACRRSWIVTSHLSRARREACCGLQMGEDFVRVGGTHRAPRHGEPFLV